MKNKILFPAFFLSAITPNFASAHAGHGESTQGLGITHYLAEPVHAFPIVVLAVIAMVSIPYLRRRRSNR